MDIDICAPVDLDPYEVIFNKTILFNSFVLLKENGLT